MKLIDTASVDVAGASTPGLRRQLAPLVSSLPHLKSAHMTADTIEGVPLNVDAALRGDCSVRLPWTPCCEVSCRCQRVQRLLKRQTGAHKSVW